MSIIHTLSYKLLKMLPKSKLGMAWSSYWLQRIDERSIFALWWILPFNGQAFRMRNFFVISDAFKPNVGIETGTFLGTTSYLFLGIPSIREFYTIESSEEYFEKARDRWAINWEKNLVKYEFIHGDSSKKISKLLESFDPESDRLLIYLDAHWEKFVPTRLELEALASWNGSWIALIDDFKVNSLVPSEVSYGYDSYAGSTIDFSLISGLDNCKLFVPRTPADRETGWRRGTGYVFSDKSLKKISPELINSLDLENISIS
jgi:hypothetical protein